MRRTVIAIVVFMVIAGILHAETSSDTLEILPAPGRKSEVLAVGLSLGATLIPCTIGYSVESEENNVGFWSLIVPGITIGPSVGHFYANQWKRGLTTAGLRLGILGAGIIWFHLATESDGSLWDRFDDAVIIGGATAIALGAHALYDIAAAQESAKKYNEMLETSGKTLIIPRIDPHHKRCGISFFYCF